MTAKDYELTIFLFNCNAFTIYSILKLISLDPCIKFTLASNRLLWTQTDFDLTCQFFELWLNGKIEPFKVLTKRERLSNKIKFLDDTEYNFYLSMFWHNNFDPESKFKGYVTIQSQPEYISDLLLDISTADFWQNFLEERNLLEPLHTSVISFTTTAESFSKKNWIKDLPLF